MAKKKTTKATSKTSKQKDAEINKVMAALSYVWILCLIPLLGKKDSEFVQFHAKQGFILFIVEILASLVVWFPLFGQLFMLLLIIIAVMGVIKALNEEWWEIPIIYDWSKKLKI